MLRVLLLILTPVAATWPALALPQSADPQPILCAEGRAVTPDFLHPSLPHCAPAPQQSHAAAPDA